MLSFHDDQKIKDMYLARVRAHREADQIVKGKYWEDGKGCAVGCTIHGDDHEAYEKELGIPSLLARIEDRIFEGLPNDKAMMFPEAFIDAVPVGVDLCMVWPEFAIWLLIDKDHGVIQYAKTDEAKKCIQDVAGLYVLVFNGETVLEKDWKRDAYAADAAASAAASAASTYTAYASSYAADAAYAAAYASVASSYAADTAADAAAYASVAAYASSYASSYAADAGHYVIMSEKLIELLKKQ